MKRLTAIVMALGFMVSAVNAFDKGDVLKCVGYKQYNFETELSYEFNEKEARDTYHIVRFKDSRTLVDSDNVVFKYYAENNNGWIIYKQANCKKGKTCNIYSVAGKASDDGYWRTGITSTTSNSIVYSICNLNK